MRIMKSFPKIRLLWLLGILLSLLALPLGAQAQSYPRNFRIASPTTNSLTLTWGAVSGATGYEYQIVLPRNYGVKTVSGGNTTSVTISSLGPSTFYGIQLRTVVNNQRSDWSGVVTRYTQPRVPRNLRTTCVAGTSVQLVWDAPDTTGQQSVERTPFEYQLRIDSGGWQSKAASRARKITQLTANTTYTFRVRATLRGDGESAATTTGDAASLEVTTAAEQIEPPTNLQASSITSSSLDVSWDASSTSSVTDYEVTYAGLGTWISSGGDLSLSFTNLSPDTNYRFTVRAKSGSNYSCASSVFTVRTLATAPTGLNTSGISQTAITLNWTKADGGTGYKVRKDPSDDWTTLGDVASYEFTGLTADTRYSMQVLAINNNGESEIAALAASTLPNPPGNPTNLSTSGIATNSITLNWAKSAGATAYKVRKDSDSWTTLGDVATHTFSGLSAGTSYSLQVIANNAGGDSASAGINGLTLPAAPTSLATSGITKTAITLSWTKATGATAYKVRLARNNSWTTLGDVATYSFSGLNANTQYTLELRANNASGDSTSASVNARTLPNAPAAPTGLATSGITQTAITLSWTKAAGATAYKVRKSSSDSWTVLGDVATHTFSSLSADTAYTLEVQANNAGGDSTIESVSARTLPNAPAAPTGLATSGITDTSITLTWSKSTGATSYKVRKDSGDGWTALGDVATSTFSGLTANTQYTLEVVAINSGGESSAATVNARTLLSAPTGLSTSGITQTAITLDWTKSTGATAYKVRVDSGSWATLGDVATHTFSSLTANTDYTLEVRASNNNGDSTVASIDASTLPNAPAAPTGLGTGTITQTSIVLNWTKSAGATAYKVRKASGDSWTTLSDVATHTFTGLIASTAYTLEVKASNAGGDSAAASVSATTNNVPPPPAPATPTSLQTSGITQTAITLTWTKSTGATAYKVRKGSDSWTTLGDVATYNFTGLTADTQYTLQVLASNAGGDSSATSVNARTLPNAPAAPTGLSSSSTKTSITLSWTKSPGATAYKVRKDSSDSWTTLSDVATYNFTSLTVDTAYTLEVRASNSGGESTSATLSARTLPNAPATPTGLNTGTITQTSIVLTWTKATGATAYKVRKSSSDSWTTLGDVATYTFSGLTANTQYTLEVLANNAGGDSAAASASASTLPNAPVTPASLSTSGITKTAITLNWDKSAGATAYKVRKDSGSWTTLGDVATYEFTGLSVGTSYNLQVTASNSGGESAAASVDISTLPNAPAAPTGLGTGTITQTSIVLNWTKATGATAYKVRKSSSDSWTTISDVATYTFTGLIANTSYTLEVKASNAGGDSAAATYTASTNSTPPPPAPAAPTGLGTGTITQTSIVLNWTKSTGATGYKVRKDSDSWTTLSDVATYTFTGLTANTQYTLEVLANNGGGDSSAATINASTLPNAPAAPTGLGTGTITQTSIVLNWTKSTGATGYKVRKDSSDAWTTLGDVATYTFTGLVANTAYTLEVVATNTGGDSSAASVSATTNNVPPPPAPAAPTSLQTSGITQTSITLSWTKSTGATGYKVRKDSSDAWTTLGDVATYEFTGLVANTAYTLEVVATNTGGDSSAATTSATTLQQQSQPSQGAPAAPTGLNTSGITQTSITLNWTKSANATAYKVRRDNRSWTTLSDVATYTFNGLSAGTQYRLEVLASNNNGDSPPVYLKLRTTPSNAQSLASPTDVYISGITANSITLNWTKVSAATGYHVEGGTLSGWTIAGDVNSYTFTGLTSNTEYALKVRARNVDSTSLAIQDTAETLPEALAAPTGLTTSGISQTAITLTWTKTAGANGYKVRIDSGSWATLGDVATHTFSGLTANTQYTLEVKASKSGVDSTAASVDVSTLPNAPAAPTGLNTGTITQTSIVLNWTKATGATAYKVRKSSSDSWTTLGDVATHTFSGLAANTQYTLEVLASNAGGDSAAASASASTLPNAPVTPASLSTSGITKTAITLNWDKSAGATAYKVRVDSGSWTTLGDVATYEFTGLSVGTSYNLQVIASNSGGESAAASVDISTLPNAPAAPTGLGTGTITQTSIVLNWTKATGATAYKVRVDSGSWTTLSDVATHTFTGLLANTAYTLEVKASNAGGDSAAASVSATTNNVPPPPAPAAPTSLQTSGITQTAITLSWTKSTSATAYKVRKGSDSWTTLGDVATHEFTGLTADTQYTLEVLANNAGGDSAAATVSASTLPNAPAAPTSLQTSGISQTAITLSWTKSAGATGYKVRKDSSDSWTTLNDVATYTFTGLIANTAYTLEVVATNTGGDSSAATSSATTLQQQSQPAQGAPAAPTGLNTTSITQTSITLNWTKSANATAYKVRRDNGSWTTLGDVATYDFTGLTADTQYKLQVVANNSNGDSLPAYVKLQTASSNRNILASPTDVYISNITADSMTLNWTKVSAATAYSVEGGTFGGFVVIGDVNSYTFTGLTSNTGYTLKVRARNIHSTSAYIQDSATTLPETLAAPTGLATSGITQASITLDWTQVGAATTYEVHGGTLSSWTDAGDVATYTFSGLAANTQYTLQVRAKDSQHTSTAVSVSEKTLPTALGAPQNVRAEQVTPSQVEVAWNEPPSAQSFQIQAGMNYQVRGGMVPEWMDVGEVYSYTFTGLNANTEYDLQVRAQMSTIISPPARITARTPGTSSANPGQTSSDRNDRDSSSSSDSSDSSDSSSSSSSSSSSGSGAGSSLIQQATPSGPAFNCNDEQKAMLATSPQPAGLHVQCLGANGIGNPDVVARGVVMGVDIWGWVRDFEVCFKPAGTVVFLDAAYSPRILTQISLYNRAGMTCTQMNRAGTLVLLNESGSALPAIVEPTAPEAPPAALGNCMVQTLDFINFRSTPGGQIIRTLPPNITLTAFDKQGDWYNADYYGRRGWLHADYVNPIGNCG